MVYVFVLRSREKGIRDVGITAGLGARLRAHARGGTKGGQHLGKFELIHRKEWPTDADARVREKYLKSGQGREWLDAKFGRHEAPDRR
jgi:putative endonuclease